MTAAALVRVPAAAACTMLFLIAMPASADPVERWAPLIHEAAGRFGLPAAWVRDVIRAESGGSTRLGGAPIASPAGAMGLMQLMPGTWREMRRALGLGTDPHDPRDNILAGSLYLRLMYDRFGYPGLFAAYNAGPGRYADHLSGRRRLPAETRAYVARVTGAIPAGAPLRPVPPRTAAARPGPQAAELFARSGSDRIFVPLSAAAR